MVDLIARGMASLSPLVTYTHTTNKEVVVSAVDFDTNTFTSVAHGLKNNDEVGVMGNIDAGNIYVIDKVPTGITPATRYFIVNKSDDTFQVSTSSGGAAVDLTANANMDLTKWHFEVTEAITKTLILPAPLQRVRVSIKGRTILQTGTLCILPNYPQDVTGQLQEWLGTGMTVYNYQKGTNSISGDVLFQSESIIDYRNNTLTISHKGMSIKSASASAVTATEIDSHWVAPAHNIGSITKFTLYTFRLANGTTIEVYRA